MQTLPTKINNNKLYQQSGLTIFIIYFTAISFANFTSFTATNKNRAFLPLKISSYTTILPANNNTTNINTVTYINNGKIFLQHINNENNFQIYTTSRSNSVLQIKNANGSTEENYSYDAYGNVIQTNTSAPLPQKMQNINSSVLQQKTNKHDTSSAITNPFQYNGERFDNNTKLQYLRARFYNLEIKRFITQDSYYKLLNKFAYVNANPIQYTDPSGHVTALKWSELTSLEQEALENKLTYCFPRLAFLRKTIESYHPNWLKETTGNDSSNNLKSLKKLFSPPFLDNSFKKIFFDAAAYKELRTNILNIMNNTITIATDTSPKFEEEKWKSILNAWYAGVENDENNETIEREQLYDEFYRDLANLHNKNGESDPYFDFTEQNQDPNRIPTEESINSLSSIDTNDSTESLLSLSLRQHQQRQAELDAALHANCFPLFQFFTSRFRQ